jgi:putative peptidoglycan lipid II flippase
MAEDPSKDSMRQTAETAESEPEPGSEAQVGRSAAMMSGLVIVSRLTGFFRTWAQAYALGVTVIASCYSVANNLPNQLYEIVIGGMLVTAFLPVYLSEKAKRGEKGASDYASNLVSIVILLMGVVTLVCIAFAAQLIWTQSFSATEEFDFDLATYFFRFFAIEILLYSLSSIFSGVLNAERDYFWSSAAPIFNNFVTTASFLAYAFLVDSNPTLALVLLALGNPLGVLVQVVVQVPALKRYGVKLRWRFDVHDPAIRETLSIGVPSLIVMLCSFETVSVMTSSALSVTAVGASVSYYARLWFTLPYSIFSVPITTAMFTELSHYVSNGDMDSYKRGVASGTSKIVFLLIPFALFLIVFARPLVTILAAGEFSAQDIEVTSSYLRALSVSLPLYGVCVYLQKVCSSLRRMQVYAISSVVAAVIQTVICLTLTTSFGLNTVAYSSTVYMLTVDVVTFWFLRHELGHIGLRSILSSVVRAAVCGIAGSLAGVACGYWLPGMFGFDASGSMLLSLVQVLIGGIPAVLVCFGGAMALRMPEMDVVKGMLRRLRHRG